MKTWKRASRVLECGGAHDQPRYIHVGEPMLELTLKLASGNTLTFIRCQACEGPAPPDLPLEDPAVRVTTWEAVDVMTRVRKLIPPPPVDYKAQAAGDRDPGEEG